MFNVLIGRGAQTGAALVAHPLVNKVSFTGSTAVGKQVGIAALHNMTRFSPDIDKAVPGAIGGGLLNQGQVCAAASRLYVPASRHAQFVEALSAQASAMSVGPGMDADAQINPQATKRHQSSVVTGGDAPDRPGYFVKPTVLSGPDQRSSTVQEEIFGPVLSMLPYDDLAQGLAMVNDCRYGLAASIWSNDLGEVMDLLPRVEAGTVWVNNHVPADPNLPFGGFEQSGMGREFGRSAIEGLTELTSVCFTY